jgi:hypothetical protein
MFAWNGRAGSAAVVGRLRPILDRLSSARQAMASEISYLMCIPNYGFVLSSCCMAASRGGVELLGLIICCWIVALGWGLDDAYHELRQRRLGRSPDRHDPPSFVFELDLYPTTYTPWRDGLDEPLVRKRAAGLVLPCQSTPMRTSVGGAKS